MKKILAILSSLLIVSCRSRMETFPTSCSMVYTDNFYKFETPQTYIKRLVRSEGDTTILYDMEIFTFDSILYINHDTTFFENWKVEYIEK